MLTQLFTVNEYLAGDYTIQKRTESLTGLSCRISPMRLSRNISSGNRIRYRSEVCDFCPEMIESSTPLFPDGKRIYIGESVTFPNKYPYSACHTVTVITRDHDPDLYTVNGIADALSGQYEAMNGCRGYHSINWNCLPSAGASMVHPHLQGLCDEQPSYVAGLYIKKSRGYYEKYEKNYWDELIGSEKRSERFMFENGVVWCAHFVPFGEKEMRGYLPVSAFKDFEECIDMVADGIVRVIDFYSKMGHYAFNMSIIFDRDDSDGSFRAFVSMIVRINPNPVSISDSAFMERLHYEPVVMTIPETMPDLWKKQQS